MGRVWCLVTQFLRSMCHERERGKASELNSFLPSRFSRVGLAVVRLISSFADPKLALEATPSESCKGQAAINEEFFCFCYSFEILEQVAGALSFSNKRIVNGSLEPPCNSCSFSPSVSLTRIPDYLCFLYPQLHRLIGLYGF